MQENMPYMYDGSHQTPPIACNCSIPLQRDKNYFIRSDKTKKSLNYVILYLHKYNINGLFICFSTSPIQPYFFFLYKSEHEKDIWKDMGKNHIKLLEFFRPGKGWKFAFKILKKKNFLLFGVFPKQMKVPQSTSQLSSLAWGVFDSFHSSQECLGIY